MATLASLITSGGFVQAIARRGEFYLGLSLPQQARRACVSLLSLGMLTSFLLAVMSLWFGFYRGLFADEYLVLGTGYYLVLSLLWMLLSILSLLSVWAVDSAYGLIFAIDSDYQRVMDLALLNFLLAVPLSEYLVYRLIRYRYQQAKIVKLENMAVLSNKLNYRYWLIITLIERVAM